MPAFFGHAGVSAAECNASAGAVTRLSIGKPFVITQLPIQTAAEKAGPSCNGMLRADYGDGGRLLVVHPDFSTQVLTEGFHSACDADVSFDGKRILFAGRKTASADWSIFEMVLDTGAVRQITRDMGQCRSPCYQSTLYTIISTKPWYQITFVSDHAGGLNETGEGKALSLYSCKLDGQSVRRLTFNLSSDMDPFIMPNGRLLYASWRRSGLDRGNLGRIGLYGVNIDGADYAAFASPQGKRIQHMPITAGGLCVFVESHKTPWDGAGSLGAVSMRRPLHSYRRLTSDREGLFHSPAPLDATRVLVARRPFNGTGTHGIHCLDTTTGQYELVYDDPRFHDMHAQAIAPRSVPDGRSSVVTEKDPHGKLYCMDVNISDQGGPDWLADELGLRIRVLEGLPVDAEKRGLAPLARMRVLGEIPVEKDGSFNIELPASIPLTLQLVGRDGAALRRCGWIWAKNHEPRGCIGCHEDGELTPQNRLAAGVTHPSVVVCPPPEKRRTVDFRRDVMPVLRNKCGKCHGPEGKKPLLALPAGEKAQTPLGFNRIYEGLFAGFSLKAEQRSGGRYIFPGKARLSPLAWSLAGRMLAKPWDKAPGTAVKKMPPKDSPALTDEEKALIMLWLDMGAHWDGNMKDTPSETASKKK